MRRKPSKSLDWKLPVRTRCGSPVKMYEIFEGRYCNGAYYSEDDDVWYPCQWDVFGQYGAHESALDIINVGKIHLGKR